MALSESRKRANEKYNAKAYDQIKIIVKKGQKEAIKANANKQGKSINEFINTAIEEKINKLSPCFVYCLDKKIKVLENKVIIPIGLKNKTNIPAFHIQLCELDNGEFVKSSAGTNHNIYDYLSADNANENETVYFSVICTEKLLGCNLYFTIQFSTVEGNVYKQDFRIQYSSTMYDGDNEGMFSMNSFYGLPYPKIE